MPLTNAERQKKYREKLRTKDESLYKAKESKRRKRNVYLMVKKFERQKDNDNRSIDQKKLLRMLLMLL